MNFKRLLNTPVGITFISILLGLGLASLFRKVCKDRNCIEFNGPIIGEISGKTYKYDEKCYKYEATPVKCDTTKKIIDLKTPDELDIPKGFSFFGGSGGSSAKP
jgi:hypothetical protein